MVKGRAAKPTPVVVVKENEPIVATDVMADVDNASQNATREGKSVGVELKDNKVER